MIRTIAIDGACRRNGKEDCIAAGACFIMELDGDVWSCETHAIHEENSTSQRGELMGLLLAMERISAFPEDTILVTDSEYLFNAITRDWVPKWEGSDWITTQGTTVKNKDLWTEIWRFYSTVQEQVTMYHIKGHLLSVGTRKYHELMASDSTGAALYSWVIDNREINADRMQHAMELSSVNNGFILEEYLVKHYAAMNLVADTVANLCVETADIAQWKAVLNSSLFTKTSTL